MRRTIMVTMLMLWGVSSARAESDQRPAPSAADLAVEGAFLPLTLPTRVGQNHLTALGLGGYDGAPLQGAVASAVVEGALYHRVAIRVGTERVPATNQASASFGLRVALLDQRRSGIDLGLMAQYKNTGFSEVNGELEFLVTAARAWGRLATFANVAIGTGLKDSSERDAEARVAATFAVGPRLNVGLDTRARFDLGEETAARMMSKLENDFDLVAGPLVTYAMGPVLLEAQGGVHTYVSHEVFQSGAIVMGGLGYAF